MDQIIKILTIVIIIILIAAFIRGFFIYVSLISAYSMFPTLKPGYRVLTLKTRSFSKIQRGDILVFYSGELGERVIKRVIGLPGDYVEILEGDNLLINGEKHPEPYVVHAGGVTGTYSVPKDSYFFLGDNRVRSKDSRHFKEPYIQKKDIKGKAVFCLNPPHRLV